MRERERKGRCGAEMFGIFYVEKCVSPRRDAPFQKLCCFTVGETPLFKTSAPPRPYTCFQVYALFLYGETTLSACTC